MDLGRDLAAKDLLGTLDGQTGDLLAQAFRSALAQSGFSSKDVDGLGVASFTLAPDHAIDLAWKLGLSPRWSMDDCHGGASAINLLQHAIRAIQAGDANVIALLSGDHFQPADFRQLAEEKGFTQNGELNAKAGEITAWLKHDFELGHGHAMAIYALLKGIKNEESE